MIQSIKEIIFYAVQMRSEFLFHCFYLKSFCQGVLLILSYLF